MGTCSLLCFTGIKPTSWKLLKVLFVTSELFILCVCVFLWIQIGNKLAFVLIITKGKDMYILIYVTNGLNNLNTYYLYLPILEIMKTKQCIHLWKWFSSYLLKIPEMLDNISEANRRSSPRPHLRIASGDRHFYLWL